jgi:two-component system, chemotaxis family, chemotaxis protein CheY
MAFNILIVDDSSAMRAVLKKTIRISGFQVGELWEAGDGQEALKVLGDKWIDLVLSDINMPNMNGLELMAAMRDNEMMSSIPIVVVSTEGSEKRRRESEALGASGYIKKPFTPQDIKITLGNIMGVEEDDTVETDDDADTFDF